MKSRKWMWIVGGSVGFLVLVGSCSAAMPNASTSSAPSVFIPASNNAVSDVSITKCGDNSSFGVSTTEVRVANSTDRTQSYMITVSLNDKNGMRLGEANGATNSLAAGQSAVVQLLGSVQGAVPATCQVANVTRIPV